jgi:DNA-binding NtrC family response regulator
MRSTSSSPPCSILVVDDDATMAGTLQEFLQQEGYTVYAACSAAEALAFQERDPRLSIALVDLIMSPVDGLALLEQLHRKNPDLAVVIMTGYGTIETAVEAMKRGAEDYLTKPFDREAVRKKVARLMEVFELRRRVQHLEANLERCACFESMVGTSPAMQRVVERARAAAATDVSVLIVGETGTGKELLARAIHLASSRAKHPFIPVNCGALPRELIESELFGFQRGAFPGAYANTRGIFATASEGTVFLDEVGEMPKDAQVKLLRILQEGELRPVGSPTAVKVNVRVVSASNHPLAALRAEFLREDLYFRIATVVIEIPPLRARSEDIVALADHFVAKLARRCGRQIQLSRPAIELLLSYSFPGNVRELENILEGASALCADDSHFISDKDIKPLLNEPAYAGIPGGLGDQPLSMERLERFAIQHALSVCQGNRTKAAALLGISRDTLHRKVRQAKEGA